MSRILIVDDKASIRQLLVKLLVGRHEVTEAVDGADALGLIARERFDVVVSDIRMPGADGLEVLRVAKSVDPLLEVVLMTAYASVQSAIDAIRAGAFDYLPKPFEPDEAVLKIERAAERRALKAHTATLERALAETLRHGDLLGRSPAMQAVFTLLEKAAQRDLTVLLQGESGTGKELAARAIHMEGPRKSEPFVSINCGALPAELIDSELFGHAKGSFTGATGARVGLLEEAGRGTVFLDEIGDLPLPLQVKLNRALQERELRRVGENQARPFHARVIAATHKPLAAEAKRGAFREDLYFRLAVFPIALPPLRERKEDIAMLAESFLARARARGATQVGFQPEALRALIEHDWPGNVRELENAVMRASALADGPLIEAHDLPADLLATSAVDGWEAAWTELPYRQALEAAASRASRAYLEAVLRETHGNVSQAAEKAGLARESLHRLLRRHGLDAATFRRS